MTSGKYTQCFIDIKGDNLCFYDGFITLRWKFKITLMEYRLEISF